MPQVSLEIVSDPLDRRGAIPRPLAAYSCTISVADDSITLSTPRLPLRLATLVRAGCEPALGNCAMRPTKR